MLKLYSVHIFSEDSEVSISDLHLDNISKSTLDVDTECRCVLANKTITTFHVCLPVHSALNTDHALTVPL